MSPNSYLRYLNSYILPIAIFTALWAVIILCILGIHSHLFLIFMISSALFFGVSYLHTLRKDFSASILFVVVSDIILLLVDDGFKSHSYTGIRFLYGINLIYCLFFIGEKRMLECVCVLVSTAIIFMIVNFTNLSPQLLNHIHMLVPDIIVYSVSGAACVLFFIALSTALFKLADVYIEQGFHERALEIFISGVKDAACLIDKSERLVWFNNSFAEFFEANFESKPYQGMDLNSVRNKRTINIAAYKSIFDRVLSGEQTDEVYIYDNDKSTSYCEFSFYPVAGRRKADDRVGLIIKDISHLRKIESDNTKMQNELFEIMAHDLKAPLMMIKGMNALSSNDDEKIHNLINKTCEYAIASINNSLSLYKYLSGSAPLAYEKVDLSVLIADKRDEFVGDAASKGLKLILKKPNESIYVRANNDSIGRVLDNLILNAIKFSNEPGKIEISVEKIGNKEVKISVSDEGIGIPDDMKQDIFKRFTKAKRSGTKGEPSTGLGLYIAHSIVSLYHGTICFKSCENKGTVFVVTLPLAEEQ